MIRTIISLDAEHKSWLDKKAEEAGLPMAELVRMAVQRMRQLDEESFDRLLQRTSGLWRRGDGLAYQRRMRTEWR